MPPSHSAFRAFAIPHRCFGRTQHRNLVFSGLLAKNPEIESVPVIGLKKFQSWSQKWNKVNLSRCNHKIGTCKTLDPPISRHASTEAATQSVSPGIPPASQSAVPIPNEFMVMNIPDISPPDPEPLIQIPYVPDFWESSPPKQPEISEPVLPKLLVVAGATTHHGGGPTHNLLDEAALSDTEQVKASTDTSKIRGQGGLWEDVAEDIGIPPPRDIKKAIFKFFS